MTSQETVTKLLLRNRKFVDSRGSSINRTDHFGLTDNKVELAISACDENKKLHVNSATLKICRYKVRPIIAVSSDFKYHTLTTYCTCTATQNV